MNCNSIQSTSEAVPKIRTTDELTGLATMMSFMEEAGEMRKNHPDRNPAFIYFDIEDFKLYNQKYGFQHGNEFLCDVAAKISDVFAGDLASRLNDDHFMVVTDGEEAEQKVAKLINAVHNLGLDERVEVKAGIYAPDAAAVDSVATMMDRARLACDSIKGKYDHHFRYYDASLAKKIEMRSYIIGNFRRAMQKNHIVAYYQPEIRALTGKVCGFEALARWIDPEYGMMSPGLFIEILEDAHLIHLLDLFIVRQVCKDLVYVREQGLGVTAVSTNLSRIDFHLADMFAEIDAIRREYDIPVELLHIEVTESALTRDAQVLHEQLERFQAAGYEIWMDDFGSGYSSLNTLKDYYFDVLKIDMAFLRDFDTKPKSKRIIAAIVSLAKDLGIHTLTEGVETKEQYEFLRNIGCEKLQGYYFGKPAPFKLQTADDWSLPEIEPSEMNDYYQSIGRVNVLSDNPLELKNRHKVSYRNQGVAILEWRHNRLNFLYANTPYRKFLQEIGFPEGPDDIMRAVNASFTEQGKGQHELIDFLLRCATSMQAESMECVLNGNICNFRAICLANDENGYAFAIMGANLSQYDVVQRAWDVDLSIRHLLWIYNRIDLIGADGKTKNVYVDSGQRLIMGMEQDNFWEIEYYAENYIAPAEQEDFMDFYNIATVEERAKTARKDHVTGFFRTKNAAGKYIMVMYIIIPFNFQGEQKFLSCVRDADNFPEMAQI